MTEVGPLPCRVDPDDLLSNCSNPNSELVTRIHSSQHTFANDRSSIKVDLTAAPGGRPLGQQSTLDNNTSPFQLQRRSNDGSCVKAVHQSSQGSDEAERHLVAQGHLVHRKEASAGECGSFLVHSDVAGMRTRRAVMMNQRHALSATAGKPCGFRASSLQVPALHL